MRQVEAEFGAKKFPNHALKLLKLNTQIICPATGAQDYEEISILVAGMKDCLMSLRLSGIFWLLMDSSTVSNTADRSRLTSITNSCRRLYTNDSGMSTLEMCGSILLSEKHSMKPDAMPDCGSADLPVRLAMALELTHRKRFVEAYGHLSIIANLSAPEIMQKKDVLFYLPAMTEFVKCCNILKKEHEGRKYAQNCLAHVTEAHHPVQVCSLRIALADAFIGEKEYARAKTTLEGILDESCPSSHLKTITSLRLSKIDRRLGVLPNLSLSSGGNLGHILHLPHDVPVDLMNECIDELTSTSSYVKQRTIDNVSTSANYLAQIKSAIPANINIADNWRITALHEQISSIEKSPKPKHHEQSVDDPRWSGLFQQEQQLVHDESISPKRNHVQPAPKLPCHLLHPHEANNEFFGRNCELRQIDRTFFPDSPPSSQPSLRSVAISGFGGMGKSQIAIQYIYLHKYRFEAIFWLHADNANVLAEDFARISLKLEMTVEGDQDLTLSRQRVQSWLSDPVRSFDEESVHSAKVSWLLVFDNVDYMSVIQDYWPYNGHGSVLITSRSPLADMSHYSIHLGIELMPFNFRETKNFIRSLTRASVAMHLEDDLEEDLTASARILGGFPLAIIWTVDVIQNFDLSLSDFVSSYDESHQPLGDEKGKVLDLDTRSLAGVWNFDSLSPEANFLLQLISFLPAETIPENMLMTGVRDIRLIADVNFNDPVVGLEGYHKAREVLTRSSLITHNTRRGEITVHRIVQSVTRSKMGTNRYSKVLSAAFTLINHAWPFQNWVGVHEIPLWRLTRGHSTSDWHVCAELLASVLSLTRHLKNMISLQTLAKSYRYINEVIARLLNGFGWHE